MAAPTILANNLLVEGMRTEFDDIYTAIRNSQSDSRLAIVMDLGLTHDNRYGFFGYIEGSPHPEEWKDGATIPTKAMKARQFEFDIWPWARRVGWNRYDKDDDKTQSMMDAARGAGENFGLIPERIFFDLLTNTTNLLPKVPNAADGVALFSTTDADSAARFGATNGNLLTGNGITTVANVRTDYYAALEQFGLYQDGEGQPMFAPEVVSSGTLIIHAVADTEIFETTFLQQRQGVLGPDNATDAVTSVQVSNIVQDASRNVQLWGTSRLATGDWYVALQNPPKKATGYITRQPVLEQTSLAGQNAGDITMSTNIEFMQWDERSGGVIGFPNQIIKVNN